MEVFETIEIRCQPMKKTFGIFDHYYFVIQDKEYHFRFTKPKICVHPKNHTVNSHLVTNFNVCKQCYDLILHNILEEKNKIKIIRKYFPFLNCESWTRGFSVQSMGIISLPLVVTLIVKKLYLYAIILFLLIIVMLLSYSKYTLSRTTIQKCIHINTPTFTEETS